MTRINLIPVTELTDQHLLAEHREIKRIPNVIASGRFSLAGAPDSYTMGTGHVKFFYNKLVFLRKRYEEIYNECIDRGFKIDNYLSAFVYVDGLYNDYIPTREALYISRQRIDSKLSARPLFYRKNGKPLYF